MTVPGTPRDIHTNLHDLSSMLSKDDSNAILLVDGSNAFKRT